MCNNCTQQILNKRHVIRHAALSPINFEKHLRRTFFQATNVHRSNSDEYEDNVQKILLRILTWKKNKQSEQADEVVIQNSFVFRVANSLKKDQDRNIRRNQFEASQISFEENQELLEDDEHQEIFTSLAEIGEDNFRTLENALSYCENDLERDALLSLSNGEKAKVFAERHNIEIDNANQIRRRAKEKVKSRIRALNQNIGEVEENHG